MMHGVIVIDFSQSMSPDSLAQWLRQEYGTDYHEDVEKLCSEFFLLIGLKLHLLVLLLSSFVCYYRSQDKWETALE